MVVKHSHPAQGSSFATNSLPAIKHYISLVFSRPQHKPVWDFVLSVTFVVDCCSTWLTDFDMVQGFSDISALRQLFEKFGPVNECHLPRNKQTGNSKGFAFVEFRQSIYADA